MKFSGFPGTRYMYPSKTRTWWLRGAPVQEKRMRPKVGKASWGAVPEESPAEQAPR